LVDLVRSNLSFSPALSIDIGGRYVTWHPYESTLNVDGSSSGNLGFGGVLRNNDGSWLYEFAGNVGKEDIWM
jgi:hypothetical protein